MTRALLYMFSRVHAGYTMHGALVLLPVILLRVKVCNKNTKGN